MFAKRLGRAMEKKGWNGADLAREASKFVPKTHTDRTGKKYEVGRHIISAYLRAANEPTDANLSYISKALQMKPEELLDPMPGADESRQYATATTGIDGKTRLTIDAEVDSDVAMQVLSLIRGAKKGRAA